MSPTHHRHLTRIDVGNEFIHHPVLEIVYRTAEQGRTYGTGALALAEEGLWAETWDGGETWHEEGNKEKALPAALVEAELAAKAAVEAQNLEKFGTTAPNSDAAAKYSHASWVEVPSALPEDTAPSARLGAQGSARSYCRTQSAA